jgi:phosphatidylglycerol---prolipoprotein diacylglyceryl transferase
MLVHPQFDPIALKLGPLAIHWYGLTYLLAFGLFLYLGSLRVKHTPYAQRGWTRRDIEDLLFYGVLGVVIGGRLGYVLFYKPGYYAANPLEIFAVWKGGMAFHGGLLGVLGAMALFARQRQRHFLEVTDLIAPCVPTGLASGRIGNFINGELPGRAADPGLPWAMVYPQVDSLPRHPSSLYSSRSKACCCSCCCGCTRASRAAWARCPACSWWATACCASRPSISASPTVFSACWRST